MFCEMYLQSTAHITTIHDLFTYPDPQSSIFDPDFPVNLEVLLIKIIIFLDHWSNHLFQCNQRFQAIEFLNHSGKDRYGISILWTWSAATRVSDSQVQSHPYKHIRDTYTSVSRVVVLKVKSLLS